jgi:hypothetical protein
MSCGEGDACGMAGERLDQQDRQRIGARRACAKVARRLDQPTSTISREAERNGGFGGYRDRSSSDNARTCAGRASPMRAQRRSCAVSPDVSARASSGALRAWSRRPIPVTVDIQAPGSTPLDATLTHLGQGLALPLRSVRERWKPHLSS